MEGCGPPQTTNQTNNNMTKLDKFNEEWYALSSSERCRIYLDYPREYDTENAWHEFDEEFFQYSSRTIQWMP